MTKMAWYDTAQLSILESAKEDSDWFTAIVLFATQLERHGYLEFKEYLEKANLNSTLVKKLLYMKHLRQIADYLLAIGKINDDERRTIESINGERNIFLHRMETKRYARGREASKKSTPLVNEAMRILKERFNVVRLRVMK